VSILADGVTLIRTRGRLQLYLEAATSGRDGFSGAFGIGVATTAAVVAGAASVPTPITEQDWEGWLFWTAIQLHAGDPITGDAVVDADLVNVQTAVQIVDIDSKAMRKLGEDMTIYGALEVTEVGTATLDWSVDSRMLFKLP